MDVDYNVAAQEGFLGTGTTELSFLHSDPLDIAVEIHSDATDIHISSTDTHDMDVGLFARLGGLAQIAGCARIEGPTLARLTLYGILEESAAAGSIFGPKVGFETEVNISVTPTTFDFYASGDMLLSVALVDLEASATVHLLFDFAIGSAEGELYGRIDCDAVVAGLSGEGQLTWHISSAMQYLQGRLKVGVISLIVSGGLEGGFFIGNNVPKALAWVLDPTDTHFGMSRNILPAMLTGVYGYGQVSIGVNYYVVGGGVDIFAGAGAFSAPIARRGSPRPVRREPATALRRGCVRHLRPRRDPRRVGQRLGLGRTSACAVRCPPTSRAPSVCAAVSPGCSAPRSVSPPASTAPGSTSPEEATWQTTQRSYKPPPRDRPRRQHLRRAAVGSGQRHRGVQPVSAGGERPADQDPADQRRHADRAALYDAAIAGRRPGGIARVGHARPGLHRGQRRHRRP